MIKYTSTAIVLKLFSSNTVTRRLYRILGNTYGVKKRLAHDIPSYYLDRVRRFLSMNAKHAIIKDGDKALEIGTGWLHWEGLTMRLFYDIEAVLFDVWDNRQLAALKHYFSRLDALLDDNIELSENQRVRAHKIIQHIVSADSFESLYRRLGLQYVVDSTGTLRFFRDNTFDVVVSAGVLEHVNREMAEPTIKEFYRVLKPGGSSVHSINIADHLFAYDRRVSRKQYLRFSDPVWKIFFQNDVQYFNRIQRSEWLALFAGSGFQLIHEEPEYAGMGDLKVHTQFKHLKTTDIECTSLKLLCRRPHKEGLEHPVTANA